MESKWYFFPGQTPQNTKISDRAHALHITRTGYAGITQHLDRKKRIQEALDKEEAHKRALKEGSEAMTKEWKDSVENLRLIKEQERKDRMGKKDNKMQLFYKMREEQDVIRKEYVAKMKKKTFLSSGYPKELTSALILSETLYERNKQIEFGAMIKKKEEEIERKHAEAIFERDRKDREKDEEDKLKKLMKERDVAKTLIEQINKREVEKSEELRTHIERETKDRIKAAAEEELIKKYEEAEKRRKIKESMEDRKKELNADRQRAQQLKKEEAEFEKAVEFYSTAKHRIECMKKQKEKEMRDEAIAARDAIAKKVAKVQEDLSAAENERIARVVAEREEAERLREQQRKELKEQEKNDKIEGRRQFLEKMAEEKRIDDEMKRWEMLNRIKTAETMKEYDEQNRREKWAKILAYRRDLLDQMAEERQVKKEEEEIERLLSQVNFEEADKMYFNYADEVLALAKSKNRTTYPIEQAIHEYKKAYNLLPRTAKRTSCKDCRDRN